MLERKGRVELWDIDSRELRRTITGFDGRISFISFDPDGQTLVTASYEVRDYKIQEKPNERDQKIVTEIKWWDVASGDFKRKTSVDGPPDLETLISPDGTTIALIKRYTEVTDVYAFRRFPGNRSNPDMFPRTSLFQNLEVKAIDVHSDWLSRSFKSNLASGRYRFRFFGIRRGPAGRVQSDRSLRARR